MITLTPVERDIHRELCAIAQSADPDNPGNGCITYTELGQLIDPDGLNPGLSRRPFRGGMFPALGHVSMYEVEHGRPMLSALVVKQETRTAGPGFADLARQLRFDVQDEEAFWRRELDEVVRFWSANDPVLLLDAAVDRVLDELKQVKTQLRKVANAVQSDRA